MLPLLWAVGTGASLLGGYLQGRAQSQQALDAARAQEENARRVRMRIADTYKRGAEEVSRTRLAAAQVSGGQAVAGGASGLDPANAGSMMADTAILSEVDVATIKANAMREALGLRVEATDLDKQAERLRKQAGNVKVATMIGLAGQTAGMAYGGWMDFAGKKV